MNSPPDRGHKLRPAKLRGMRTYNMSGDDATPAEGVDLWGQGSAGCDIRTNTCCGACSRPLHADCNGAGHVRWVVPSPPIAGEKQLQSAGKRHRLLVLLKWTRLNRI